MSFSSLKGEFDRFFNRLDRPVEESRPDRFPSLIRTLGSPAMALNRFRILLFVQTAPEVLAEIKRTICTAFYSLILRLELSRKAIENKVPYAMSTTLYYFSNRKRKQIDRPEVRRSKGEERTVNKGPTP